MWGITEIFMVGGNPSEHIHGKRDGMFFVNNYGQKERT